MPTCYVCQALLTPGNFSDEHIIPNAIGGRLRSKDLLCRDCNSKFGSDCDRELAEQLSIVTSFLQVKKHRGEINPIKGGETASGEQYTLLGGNKPVLAKPVFEKTEKDGQIGYHIVARDEAELRAMLAGLARKYPQFEVDEAMPHALRSQEYLSEPIKFNFKVGGDLAFRSIAKTAVNYFMFKGGDRGEIESLLPYLLGQEKRDIVDHFYQAEFPYAETEGEVLHVLHLIGDTEQRILYAYVQFFSVYSFIVLLSEQYAGLDLTHSYLFDVRQVKEIEKEVSLKVTRDEIATLLTQNARSTASPIIVQRMQKVMAIAERGHREQAIEEISRLAMEKVMAKYGNPERLTAEMLDEVGEEATLNFAKYMTRDMKIDGGEEEREVM